MADMPLNGGSPSADVFNDREIRDGLAVAELIPLLLALASSRHDAELLEERFRPALLTPIIGALAQGGLEVGVLDQLRARIAEHLASLTVDDLELRPLSDEFLMQCLQFMTGQRDAGYLPVLRRELNWGIDTDRPPSDLGERTGGRRVAIVGGGISGVALATRLVQAGVDFVLFEKNLDLGGTWLENRYPGCRLDTSNFGYSYSFAQTIWRHYFSTRDEVRDYILNVAEVEGVLPHVRFGAEVSKATWTGERWRLTVGERAEEFDFVVSAVGQLNRPKLPEIPGMKTFAGESWHSATWPDSADVADRRVALIGTGASGYQIGPAIAGQVEALTVFQRTPPWILPTPGYSSELPVPYHTLLERFPAYRRWLRFYQFWVAMEGRLRFTHADPQWTGEGSVSAVNAEFRGVLERSLRTQFDGHSDLLDVVVPDYPPGSKRILRDDGAWAAMLKRPDVELIAEGIDHIEPAGIVTTSGRLIELDVIVFATGFQADRFLAPMTIIGDGGRQLSEQWGDRAETYLGMSVHGFPNFAMLYGPNTNLVVNGSLVFLIECAVDRILRMIAHVADCDAVSIDVPERVVDEFVEEIDRENAAMAWGDPRVVNWYKGSSGRVVSVWPFSMLRFWEQSRRDDFADWTVVREQQEAR
jgi:4-hydroxyacetophenone monooxygenase